MKKEIHFFSNYEIDVLKDFLEKKALKGWKLHRKMGIFYYFKKIEPCKLNYLVFLSQEKVLEKYKSYIVNDKYEEYMDLYDIKYESECDSYDIRWHYICTDKDINICYYEDTSRLPRFEYSEKPSLLTKKEEVFRYFSIIGILLYILVILSYPLGKFFSSSKLILINAFLFSLTIWDFGKFLEVIYWKIKDDSKSVLIYCRKIRVCIVYLCISLAIPIIITSLITNFSILEFINIILVILCLIWTINKRSSNIIKVNNSLLFSFKMILINFTYFIIVLSIISYPEFLISAFSDKKTFVDDNGHSHDINNDNIYVTLDDLGIKTNDGYGTQHSHTETILSQYDELTNRYEADDNNSDVETLTISISSCNIKPLFNIIKNSVLRNTDYSIYADNSSWNESIEDVYICSDKHIENSDEYYYILILNDRVIKVEVSTKLSYDNLNLIVEKTALIN